MRACFSIQIKKLSYRAERTLPTRTTSLSFFGVIADAAGTAHRPTTGAARGGARDEGLAVALALQELHADKVGAGLCGKALACEEGGEEEKVGEHIGESWGD